MNQLTPTEIWALETQLVGKKTMVFDAVSSTSDIANQYSSQVECDGLTILAREQKAGRGQHGRVWCAGRDQSVLLSVLLFPPTNLRKPSLLTSLAAVSVVKTVESFVGFRPNIKWPNDILSAGRKLCGILIEQNHAVVMGIGLNVCQSQADFGIHGLGEAISMQELTPYHLTSQEVAKRLLIHLDEEYQSLLCGNISGLQNDWQTGLGLLGKEVCIEVHNKKHHGLLTKLSFEEIEILNTSGSVTRMIPEKINHIYAV